MTTKSFSMKDSFNKHSRNYEKRVLNRNKYANLFLENELILDEILWLINNSTLNIIDSWCWTWDRLKCILEDWKVNRDFIGTIYGYDYAKEMLKIAAKKEYEWQKLYDKLIEIDLTKDSLEYKWNLVLCLWWILNWLINKHDQIINNLSSQITDDWIIIFDVLTIKPLKILKERESEILKIYTKLPIFEDKRTLWYKRDDDSVWYMKLMQIEELNDIIKRNHLKFKKVYWYNMNELKPKILTKDSQEIPIEYESKYSFLICIIKKYYG